MEKINLIIDCDAGVDDAIAIIMAALSEDINLIGISICSGNNSLENVYKNTKETLNILDKNIPIIKGYPRPVDRKIARSPDIGEERNIILEDFYIDSINSYKDVVLLSIGPMTNLYWLLKNRPEIFKKLNKIISMGGAYEVRGNVTEFAEYNYWADSIAADYFYYNSGIIIDMIPLDITEKVFLEEKNLDDLEILNPKIGGFIKRICKYNFSFNNTCSNQEKYYLHDPLTLGLILDGNLMEGFKAYSRIKCLDYERGKLLVDRNISDDQVNSYIYNKVKADEFIHLLYRLLENN